MLQTPLLITVCCSLSNPPFSPVSPHPPTSSASSYFYFLPPPFLKNFPVSFNPTLLPFFLFLLLLFFLQPTLPFLLLAPPSPVSIQRPSLSLSCCFLTCLIFRSLSRCHTSFTWSSSQSYFFPTSPLKSPPSTSLYLFPAFISILLLPYHSIRFDLQPAPPFSFPSAPPSLIPPRTPPPSFSLISIYCVITFSSSKLENM